MFSMPANDSLTVHEMAMVWTDTKTLTLIEEYKKYPCLWDHSDEFNKSLAKKNQAWAEIAQVLQFGVSEIKRKMASLLASFRRERKRPSGSTWFAYNQLSFLLCNYVKRTPWVEEASGNQKHHLMTKDHYLTILHEVKEAHLMKAGSKPLSAKQYRRIKRFDIIIMSGVEKLIKKRNKDSDAILYFVSSDEIFSIIHHAHLTTGHRRHRALEEELKKKYANITREAIDIYLKLCQPCQLKKSAPKRGIVVEPIEGAEGDDSTEWWIEPDGITEQDLLNTSDVEDKSEIQLSIKETFTNSHEYVQANPLGEADDTIPTVQRRSLPPPRKRPKLDRPIEYYSNEDYHVHQKFAATPKPKSISELFIAYLAAKMDTYTEYERNVVQHKINDILFQADIGMFTKANTSKNDNPSENGNVQ